MTACLFMAALNVCAQTKEKDSLRVIDLQEVEIISTRATGTTPVAFTNINKEQLKKQNFGQDLPYLLSMTPSAITTSDAGSGYRVYHIESTRYGQEHASTSPPTVFLSMMPKATMYFG